MICSYTDCNEKAIYGYKYKNCEFCKVHKKEQMVTKPTQYCEHGKRKTQCIDCKGAAICIHGKQKYTCKDCKSNTDNLNQKLEKIKIIDDTPKLCVDCNCKITLNATRCDHCNRKFNSKVKDRPSLEQLLKDISNIGSLTGVGRKYDVNSNTIRKWLTAYNYEVKCAICQKPVKSFGKFCYECKKN